MKEKPDGSPVAPLQAELNLPKDNILVRPGTSKAIIPATHAFKNVCHPTKEIFAQEWDFTGFYQYWIPLSNLLNGLILYQFSYQCTAGER